MSPLPPQTEEQRDRSTRLQDLVAKAKAAYDALSPVDRAIADTRQRESFVRGNVGFDWPESERPRLDAAVKNNPQSILADEVERLRGRAKEDASLIENLQAQIGLITRGPAFNYTVPSTPETAVGKSFYANSVDKCVVAETPEPGDLVEVKSFAWRGTKGRVFCGGANLIVIETEKGNRLFFRPDDLKVIEKAKPAEDPMFAEVVEVGDRVTFKQGYGGSYAMLQGVVRDLYKNEATVLFDGADGVTVCDHVVLTVVEKAEKESPRD